jgi:uncharacterized phage protein (TIGR02220 family)
MAENKKSFVLYSDQRTLIELLSNEQAGVLLKHIFAYVNDENPICKDQLINIAFEPIKQQFKRDLIKWVSTKEGRSKAGLASAEARRINKLQQTSTNVNNVQQSSTNSTVNDNVNVNVNDINIINFEKLLDYINLSFDRQFKIINAKVKSSFKARIKEGYTNEDIKNCIDNIKNNKYHIENGFQYCTPEYISRAVTLDKFSKVNSIVTKDTTVLDDYASNVMKQVEALKNLNK